MASSKESKDLAEYKKQLKTNLKKVAPIFVKASIGDFSENVVIPEKEDELTVFLVGVQIILDAIREKIAESEASLMKLNTVNSELKKERALYRAILSSIAEGMVVVDNKARITLINQAGAKLLGVNEKEVRSVQYYDLVVTKDRNNKVLPISERPLHKAHTTGKQYTTNITDGLQYINSKGAAIPVAITTAPIKTGDTIIGGVSTFRDISEEIQLDRSKSEIISIASHQLRTPLTSVKWLTEQLISPIPRISLLKQRRKLRQIHESNDRMIDLVNDLLNVSRVDLGRLSTTVQPFDFIKLVNDVLSDLTSQIKLRKLKVSKYLDPKLKSITTDQSYIQVILQNLISNAIKYSFSKKSIKISSQLKGSELVIAVTDNGCGIPKSQQANIFTKLFRADNARQMASDGTGLGLYVVKAMVKELNGKIWFKSVENEGSIFYVSIPLDKSKKSN